MISVVINLIMAILNPEAAMMKLLFFALSAFRVTHPALYYLLAGLLVLSPFIKINTSAAYVSEVQIGAPWLLPFDSPIAYCARGKADDLFSCSFEAKMARANITGTIMEFRCESCFELARSFSLLVSWDRARFNSRYAIIEDWVATLSEWRPSARPAQALPK